MSTFDPNAFLQTTYTESMATQYVPIPEGIFNVTTGQPSVAHGISEKNQQPWYRLDLPLTVDSDEVRQAMGREEVKTKFTIMLDIDENGHLARGIGRNVQLGRLREALGLNGEGEDFSLPMLGGRACKAAFQHRANPKRQGEVISDPTELAAI
jgi:hypothetical protein